MAKMPITGRTKNKNMKRSIILLFTLIMVSALLNGQEKYNRVVVLAGNPGPVISKDIYGHFSEHLGTCIYGGLWVGKDSKIANLNGLRTDVVNALKEMKIPNLRWPGGCFADTYHWRDGIGPQEKRASIVNVHWGGVTEDNSFGTHEFMELTEMVDCDAYVNGNIGSGTVQEMAEWVEYLTSANESPVTNLRKENGRSEPWKVRFFAIGNETWGCGGSMTAEYYAGLMRQYSTFLRDYSGNKLYRVACGPYGSDFKWTETLMKDPGTRNMFQGISIHYYTVVDGWDYKGSATEFDEREWFETVRLNLDIDNIISKHEAVMDLYDPERTKGIVVDEWGNWFNVEPGTNTGFLYQQNSMRDAITAAIHLNIFNNHAARVRVANLAQLANVLQSVILTKDEKMVLTPTYHVFRMFSVHQEARLVPVDVLCEDYAYGGKKIPAISVSASVDKEGTLHISLANLNPAREIPVSCLIEGLNAGKITGEVLTAQAMNSFNSFEKPETVCPVKFDDFRMKEGRLTVNMPSKSVVVIEIKTTK
jgi:alpha-N-arabinofuranosidase